STAGRPAAATAARPRTPHRRRGAGRENGYRRWRRPMSPCKTPPPVRHKDHFTERAVVSLSAQRRAVPGLTGGGLAPLHGGPERLEADPVGVPLGHLEQRLDQGV